ncbi:16S rRNA (cytosine(1402)-N(4))-methyltransferase [Alkalilimnicola ehrlichii]|uniref:Ribosomal RNA small subunit methyltransferase H n=1 Tax=Alkalilimnicola ehrlichii TaxID=351052 RepID=A0A3E0X0F3_9GAMM|nr:16S rRNA (cytosine(1402)-N(4))-methyltransferase RsmH [Alkalilimnicola ehrlichii]RFA30317.1 16S rRNA (cytosine(1402)-N(4))-methyltransferase [Alkalilimnicola ehrlichii]RFA37893.1 16S rRNA (cytosine(1402)-N(4))-methyltransferase [Alkalilimnicola ehrlichii]
MQEYAHRSVLLAESVDALAIRSDGLYVDGTFGRGGHSEAILAKLNDKGRLWMIDKDGQAVDYARQRFGTDPRCLIRQGSFVQLSELASEQGCRGKIDGILLDLGVSSPQLDDPVRGFSFLRDGPLDMRMDASRGMSAAEWLAEAAPEEIAEVLREYGEERFAKRIARAIVLARESGAAPQTTQQLVALIEAALPFKERNKHPATRSFQAIRIFINRELDELRALLDDACDLLAPGGRLAVISFHSLEDRLVKRFMRDKSSVGYLPPEVPVVPEERRPRLKLVGKPVRAGEAELAVNPRSRSAVLRVAERLS